MRGGKVKYYKEYIDFAPIAFAIVGEGISPVYPSEGLLLKNLSLLSALCHVVFSKQKIYNLASIVFLNTFLVIGIFLSFNFQAALISYYKYLFPFIFVLYGYSIKRGDAFVNNLLRFSIFNNIVQIFIYGLWLLGYSLWFFNKTEGGIIYGNMFVGLLRGTGVFGFFGVYGFFNLIMFFVAYFSNCSSRLRNWALTLSFFGIISSFSMKTIGVFIVFSLFYLKNVKGVVALIGSIGISLAFLFLDFFQKIREQISLRLAFYIFEGNSARSESYRVMFDELGSLNFFGRGLGSFGGAEAMFFGSPVYSEVNFNWYDTPHLTTTDTYYPHLFVEIGLIGGLVYIFTLLMPLIMSMLSVNQDKVKMVFIIYGALLVDSLFSFGLNSLIYVSLSLSIVYPILKSQSCFRC